MIKQTLLTALLTAGLLVGSIAQSAGKIGPKGPRGPIGKTGPRGPIGKTGPAGIVGSIGPKGDMGTTGPQGITGPAGITGPIGEKGPAGVGVVSAPCVLADLEGVWTIAVNGMVSNTTTECVFTINSTGTFTNGVCSNVLDFNTKIYPLSGTASIISQCLANFTVVMPYGTVYSRGQVSRGRDTLIGTFVDTTGDHGTYSGARY